MAYLFWDHKKGRCVVPPCDSCGSVTTYEDQTSCPDDAKLRDIHVACMSCKHRTPVGRYRSLGGHRWRREGNIGDASPGRRTLSNEATKNVEIPNDAGRSRKPATSANLMRKDEPGSVDTKGQNPGSRDFSCPICSGTIRIPDLLYLDCPVCHHQQAGGLEALVGGCTCCAYDPYFRSCVHCEQYFDGSRLVGSYSHVDGFPLPTSVQLTFPGRFAVSLSDISVQFLAGQWQRAVEALSTGKLSSISTSEPDTIDETSSLALALAGAISACTFSSPFRPGCLVVKRVHLSDDGRLWLHSNIYEQESPNPLVDKHFGQVSFVHIPNAKDLSRLAHLECVHVEVIGVPAQSSKDQRMTGVYRIKDFIDRGELRFNIEPTAQQSHPLTDAQVRRLLSCFKDVVFISRQDLRSILVASASDRLPGRSHMRLAIYDKAFNELELGDHEHVPVAELALEYGGDLRVVQAQATVGMITVPTPLRSPSPLAAQLRAANASLSTSERHVDPTEVASEIDTMVKPTMIEALAVPSSPSTTVSPGWREILLSAGFALAVVIIAFIFGALRDKAPVLRETTSLPTSSNGLISTNRALPSNAFRVRRECNVRKEPSLGSASVDTVVNGEPCINLGRAGDWISVDCWEVQVRGWVNAVCLVPMGSQSAPKKPKTSGKSARPSPTQTVSMESATTSVSGSGSTTMGAKRSTTKDSATSTSSASAPACVAEKVEIAHRSTEFLYYSLKIAKPTDSEAYQKDLGAVCQYLMQGHDAASMVEAVNKAQQLPPTSSLAVLLNRSIGR